MERTPIQLGAEAIFRLVLMWPLLPAP
nr:RecName: Full=Sarcoma antigen S35 [Mus musculus]